MISNHQRRDRMPSRHFTVTAPTPVPRMRRERADDNKMISVEIKFWTNKIAENKGDIIPRVAREAGVIKVLSNSRHGIKGNVKPIPFHSLPHLSVKLEDALVENEIEL